MNFYPAFEAIKIGQANPGDLLIIPREKVPALVFTEPDNKFKFLLGLGPESEVGKIEGNISAETAFRVVECWQFRLTAIVTGKRVLHPAIGEKAQIALNEYGKYFRSTFSGRSRLDALINLDTLCMVSPTEDVAGDSLNFSWELEIQSSGDKWENLDKFIELVGE
jgi:hypothetical protein